MVKQSTADYHTLVGRKLMELANLLFVGFLLISLFDKAQALYLVAVIGLVIFAGLYLLALWLMSRTYDKD